MKLALVLITLVLITIVLINLIFGYWRSNTRKQSLQWALAIHIPVPIAIGLRLALLGWSWLLLPATVAAFTAGQFIGGRIRCYWARQQNVPLSSLLVRDLIQVLAADRAKYDLDYT